MEISIDELRKLLTEAAELGAKKALIDAGYNRWFFKQSQAFKIYGRAAVEKWIREGLIKPVKEGSGSSTVKLSKLRLEVLSKTSKIRTSQL